MRAVFAIIQTLNEPRFSPFWVKIRPFRPRAAKHYKTKAKLMVSEAHFAKNAKFSEIPRNLVISALFADFRENRVFAGEPENPVDHPSREQELLGPGRVRYRVQAIPFSFPSRVPFQRVQGREAPLPPSLQSSYHKLWRRHKLS